MAASTVEAIDGSIVVKGDDTEKVFCGLSGFRAVTSYPPLTYEALPLSSWLLSGTHPDWGLLKLSAKTCCPGGDVTVDAVDVLLLDGPPPDPNCVTTTTATTATTITAAAPNSRARRRDRRGGFATVLGPAPGGGGGAISAPASRAVGVSGPAATSRCVSAGVAGAVGSSGAVGLASGDVWRSSESR